MNEFQCSGGSCISKRAVCDGLKDCLLGDDEDPEYCFSNSPGGLNHLTSRPILDPSPSTQTPPIITIPIPGPAPDEEDNYSETINEYEDENYGESASSEQEQGSINGNDASLRIPMPSYDEVVSSAEEEHGWGHFDSLNNNNKFNSENNAYENWNDLSDFLDHSSEIEKLTPKTKQYPEYTSTYHEIITEDVHESIPYDYEDSSESISSVHEDNGEGIPSVHVNNVEGIPSVYEDNGEGISSVHANNAEGIPSVYEDNAEGIPSVYEDNNESTPSVYENKNEVIPFIYEEENNYINEISEKNYNDDDDDDEGYTETTSEPEGNACHPFCVSLYLGINGIYFFRYIILLLIYC